MNSGVDERGVVMGWLVIPAVLALVASGCGLLSVRYCFGRTVMLFFTGASMTALVLVMSSALHL